MAPGPSDSAKKPDQLTVETLLLGSKTIPQKALRIALTAIRMVLAMIGLYLLIRLFGFYSREQVFTREDVNALRRIGYFLLIWVSFNQFGHLLKSPLPTTGSPISTSVQVVAFGIATAAEICFAVMVILLSLIMGDRRRLRNMQHEKNTDRVRRLSEILRLLCLFALVLLPVSQVIYWSHVEYFRALHLDDFTGCWPKVADMWPISTSSKIVGFVARLFPLTVIMIALVFLIKLLGLVSRGDTFSAAGARHARVIGYAVIVGQVLRPFYDTLTTIAFAINAPPGTKASNISFGVDNLSYFAFGLMMLLLSRILDEGRKFDEWPDDHAEIC